MSDIDVCSKIDEKYLLLQNLNHNLSKESFLNAK